MIPPSSLSRTARALRADRFPDLRENFLGGLVQLTQFLSVAVLNIILPRILGPQGFGLAVAVLAIPYAVYGLAERAVLNAVIQGATRAGLSVQHRMAALAAATRDVALVFLLSAVVTFVLADDITRVLGAAERDAAAVASLVFLPMGFNVLLFALAYAEQRTADALRANFLHGVVLNLVSILCCWVLGMGPVGMVIGLLAAQVICAASLLRASRSRLASLFRWRDIKRAVLRTVRLNYLAALPTQITEVVLTSLLVPLIAVLLSLEAAATYKIAISMVLAGAVVTPISTPVAQVTIARRWLRSERVREVGRYLGGVGLVAGSVGLVGGLVVYLAGRWLIDLLYGPQFPLLLGALKFLVLAQVPLVALRVLAAFFLGTGQPRLLAVLSGGTGVVTFFAAVVACQSTGNVVYVAGILALTLTLAALIQMIHAVKVLREAGPPLHPRLDTDRR